MRTSRVREMSLWRCCWSSLPPQDLPRGKKSQSDALDDFNIISLIENIENPTTRRFPGRLVSLKNIVSLDMARQSAGDNGKTPKVWGDPPSNWRQLRGRARVVHSDGNTTQLQRASKRGAGEKKRGQGGASTRTAHYKLDPWKLQNHPTHPDCLHRLSTEVINQFMLQSCKSVPFFDRPSRFSLPKRKTHFSQPDQLFLWNL